MVYCRLLAALCLLPMPTARLAAASLNQTPADWRGNLVRVVAAIEAARGEGVGLLVLPELALSAYGCEDLFFAADIRQRAVDSLVELIPRTGGIAVSVGLPLVVGGVLYNGQAMFADGRLLGFSCKQHLANDGVHYEARWFTAWPAGRVDSIDVAGESVPVGDLVYDFAGVGVGVEICRDAWVEQRPAHAFAERGASVVLNPSASHFAFGKQRTRERLTREGAAAVRGVAVYVNLLGNESGRTVFDGGALCGASDGAEGQLVGSGRRFSYADHTLTVFETEVEARQPTADPATVCTGFAITSPGDRPAAPPPLGDSQQSKFEEFSHAVPLALFDYLRKSGARGFVLSLSGGADSAACAVLVGLMARYAIGELGRAGFAERLPNVAGLADADSPEAAVRCLLTTVYQATRNSSDTTRDAAASVAGAVGAEHHAWSVDELVAGYTDRVATAIGRELTWDTDDLTLQNIQSRARSPGVWMLANLKNALLLTTGNRSEASVGYATMDGDTSGGLAPLSGVDKAFLCEWLRWMEAEGPAGIGPLPALAAINAQQPTAELRPAPEDDTSDGQTDEADLMPYPVLDAIERSAIARLETPAETLAAITEQFPDESPEQLSAWIDRFWRLWRASQWKRERMAPGFHLDTHSVDPRAWRRWPILSAERSKPSDP